MPKKKKQYNNAEMLFTLVQEILTLVQGDTGELPLCGESRDAGWENVVCKKMMRRISLTSVTNQIRRPWCAVCRQRWRCRHHRISCTPSRSVHTLLWCKYSQLDKRLCQTHLVRFIVWGWVGAWWYCRYLGQIRFPGLRDQPFRKDPLVIWKLVSIISRCDLTKSENGEYEKPDELIDGIDPDW